MVANKKTKKVLAITLNYSKFYPVLDSVPPFALLGPASSSAHGVLSLAARPDDDMVGRWGWGGRGSVWWCNGHLCRPPIWSQRQRAVRHVAQRTKESVAFACLSFSLVLYCVPPRLVWSGRWTPKKEKKKEKRTLYYSSICKHNFMCTT